MPKSVVPAIRETVNSSPSGSESTPNPSSSEITLPVLVVLVTFTAAVLSVAVGPGLVTVQLNESVVVWPHGSVAVTTTLNGPSCEALLSIVPEMTPVSASIVKPVGKSVAL